MQRRLLARSLLLFLLTSCFAFCLQANTANQDEVRNDAENFRWKRAIVKKPGFFRTLFSVIYEQWSDTKDTLNKVNNMINDNFLPENAPPVEVTTPSNDPNVTTTMAPYKIKRSEFNKIVNRNLRGLVRLFNIELQDALQQSKKNMAEYKRNTSIAVGKFL